MLVPILAQLGEPAPRRGMTGNRLNRAGLRVHLPPHGHADSKPRPSWWPWSRKTVAPLTRARRCALTRWFTGYSIITAICDTNRPQGTKDGPRRHLRPKTVQGSFIHRSVENTGISRGAGYGCSQEIQLGGRKPVRAPTLMFSGQGSDSAVTLRDFRTCWAPGWSRQALDRAIAGFSADGRS